MSIIKRKAGSEDIVKSVLEFDAVPTEGSPNLVDSGSVAKAIGNLGQPLQWKGPATVAELNAGITGIQGGWTYTLTDAGTLTDGSIVVDVGDEVAWTGTAWFKVGGEGGVKILHGSSNPGGTTYPDAEDVVNAVAQGKEVIIFWNSSGNLYVYRLEYMLGYATSGDDSYVFRCIEDYNQMKILSQVDGTYTWSWKMDNKIPYPSSIAAQYSDQSTYAEGDYCMYCGLLYVCTTAIPVAEVWDGSHWQRTSISDTIGSINVPIAVFTGTYDHTATPPVFTGLPDTTAIAAAIDAGKYVVLLLTNNDTVFTYVLAVNNQGYKLFYRTADESVGIGYGTYHPGLVMTYGGPGNPWGWATTRFDADRCLVISVSYDSYTSSYTWPSYSNIASVFAGNIIVLDQSTPSGDHNTYILDEWSYGNYFHFIGKDGTWLKIDSANNVSTGYIVSVHDGGVLTDAASVNVPNNALSTLATAQATLTLNVNVASGEVPNFAVEITPSVDVTLTVTKTVGNTVTTLNPSASGGDSLTTGKLYQVTCVGSCWTLAEFTVPTP